MPDSDPFGVLNRTFVVIGGTAGLGLSAAKALVANGANVVVAGRSPANLDRALSELGSAARGLTGDAADPDTAKTAVAFAVDSFGKLDGLYHVAGGSGRSKGDGPLHEITDEGWSFTCDLNLSSLIYSNRAAVQQLLEQGSGGSILNMGSVLGFSPSPAFFASHGYAATKSAALGFTKSIAAYYAQQNIRANVVAPALVETPMSERAQTNEDIMNFVATKQPLDGGRIGTPNDLDEAVLYLLGSRSKFVTGQVLAVDGGWSVTEGQL
ncbi:MAG: NAD(P)-dependent dehydrogenase (short-subunit alcohol dehydrogenase family) [Verrucomicrobiales bacterium]|jgi:NAD(P)-dependent dehydrogenase (short-subunit alcohol dehydrogenase family)